MNKDSTERPIVLPEHGNSDSNDRDELMTYGYVRQQAIANKVALPDDIIRIIVEYSKADIKLLQFDKVVNSVVERYWEFNDETTMATKIGGNCFWNILGNVPNNVDTSKGIHYFRLKIENPRKLDMLW